MTSTRIVRGGTQDPAQTKANGNGHAAARLLKRPLNDWDDLPKQLREEGNFVVWRDNGGRKVPYSPHNPAKCASSTDPSTWAGFELAQSVCNTFHFDGIHAVCSPQFVFIDIDDCIEDGHISESAVEVIESLPPTYWEVSPSGTGVHGVVTLERAATFRNIVKGQGKNNVEVYADKHFMSCTGSQLSDTSEIARVDSAQLEKFRVSKRAFERPATDGAAQIPQGSRHGALVKLAGGMRRQGADRATIEAALREHNSRCSPPLDEKAIQGVLKSAEKWETGDLLSQACCDVGNAERLLQYGQGNYRFIPAYNRWVVYDGKHWPVEDPEQETIRSEAHAMLDAFCIQALSAQQEQEKTIKFAVGSRNTFRITHLLREAQPHTVLRIADMDHDPLLVNFQNGTFDARTGKLRLHKREDYITSVLAYDYSPKAKCPMWEEFVAETFNGDRKLIEYTQRTLGYSMTGVTSEKCAFLAHGPKDTAKTTLLNVVGTLLGRYAGRIKVESLMVERRGHGPDSNAQADLADLRGKRFVNTSETGQGQFLREETVKMLTQGQGEYRAVRKYQNPFSFPETWKLWLDCNHLPVVHGTDDAIWERLIVIPFVHIVPAAKQNRNLAHELVRTEAEGILAWLVRGLLAWRAKGLRPPAAIEAQRTQWRAEADDLQQWLDEECTKKLTEKQRAEANKRTAKPLLEDVGTESIKLYAQWRFWQESRGIKYPDSMNVFARKMKEHGFSKRAFGHAKTQTWHGVWLKPPAEEKKY